MAHAFEKLHAWQVAHRLALRVYRVSGTFPKFELYGLTSQMRRAATSAPANIAEGSCSRSKREFARYLGIARRSTNETAYWLRVAVDLEYLTREDWNDLDSQTMHSGRVIWALERSLKLN